MSMKLALSRRRNRMSHLMPKLTLLGPAAILLATLSVTACSSGSTTPAPAKEAVEARTPEPVAASAEEEGPAPFDIEVNDWEGPAGEEAQVLVTVKAKTGFKINAKYPHKVSLDPPPAGLTLPMTTIRKEDAQVNGDESITYTIPATAAEAGEYQLQGVVRLSVCNEEQCRMAKEKLTAKLTAQ